MKNTTLLILIIFITTRAFSQVYFCDQSNTIYKIDPANCEIVSQFEVGVQDTLMDIAIRMDGQLYGITNSGQLYQINPETGDVLLVHSFLNLQKFLALYCNAEGIIFTGGSEGFLYSYEISSQSEQFLGDLGSDPIEDLVTYANHLYASTSNQKLIHINQDDVTKSTVVFQQFDDTQFAGLFSMDDPLNPCAPLSMWGVSSDGRVFSIDIDSLTKQEICTFEINAQGATGIRDLSQFSSLTIESFITSNSQCSRDNGSILIEASGGFGDLKYTIENNDFQDINSFADLSPGTYKVQVKDENNCTKSIEDIKIERTPNPVIDSIMKTNPICNGGSGTITVIATGAGPLQYAMDDAAFQIEGFFETVSSGSHTISVRDTNGCEANGVVAIADQGNFHIKGINIMAASCDENNGSIELELSQEYSDLTYSIDDQLQSVPFFDNLSAGLHNISISKGVDCTLDTSLLVSSDPCPLFIPDAFSPNADGINDEFRIFTSDNNDILVKSYAIFDRWGGHIFNAENFSIHESNHWWDGSVNAKNITQGLYVYVIELVHVDGKHEILKGEVSIL